MSLILWEYFWTEADWVTSASSTSTAVVALTSSGGGGGHAKDPYYPLTEEFWEIREHHLRTHVEPLLREVIPLEVELAETTETSATSELPLEDDALFILQFKRNAALRRAYAATSEAELYATANRVVKLTLDISNYISQYYAQAAMILLLDLF